MGTISGQILLQWLLPGHVVSFFRGKRTRAKQIHGDMSMGKRCDLTIKVLSDHLPNNHLSYIITTRSPRLPF